MRFFPILVLFSLSIPVVGQSRRVNPAVPRPTVETAASDPTAGRSVKELFDEANTYNKVKFAEFEQKKVPVSDALIARTQRERKQLAAKYAAIVQGRAGLTSEELYHLGMLHWIADNLDATLETFVRYLSGGSLPADRAQDARAIVAVIYARKKNFPEAEKVLTDYRKVSPVRPSQRGQIERELALSLVSVGDLAAGAPHAEEAYAAYKSVAGDPTARDKIIDEIIDSGLYLFKIYRRLGRQTEADATLVDLRKTGITLQSGTLWYYAVDSQVKYQIETGRKMLALENSALLPAEAGKEFQSKAVATDLQQKLKRREKHYRLLGGPAPELTGLDQYFPGERRTLADLKGKVVLLDFWAAWCIPCIEAFPSMLEWQQDFGPQGFVILGLTRYYGAAEGFPVDNASELDFLKRFRRSHGLTYDLLVAKDEGNHRMWGATAIPTAALIDRNGVVRYLETGTSPNRLEELRENIVRLLAEK